MRYLTLMTFILVRTEVRLLFNQFKRTIRNPSMVSFYGVTICGAFFVSFVVAELGQLAPLLVGTFMVLEEVMDRSMVFLVIGLATLSSVVVGFFDKGPAGLLLETDEYIILPAPVQPYQIFLAKYIHRIVRKIFIIFVVILALLPLLISLNFLAIPALILVMSFITFSEVNFFLGGISSYLRIKLEQKTKSRLRYLILVVLGFAVYIPTTAEFSFFTITHLFIPSNALSMILIETTGLLSIGYQIEVGIMCLVYAFILGLLVLAILCSHDYYDEFAKTVGSVESESTYSKLIRGEIEFSSSRYKDPIAWIILKDFWSKMRTPLQFWKYIYVVIGTAFGLYFILAQPSWFPPIIIPPELSSAAIPAFLLLLLLLTQMTTIPSLLSFIEEKENVYLLKASPFRDRDIILGKYILCVIEIGLSALPVYSLLVYFFNIRGASFLISIAAPLLLIFSASGIMVGAYIPVFTNDPRTPPVPLAFAFPSINLAIGGLLIALIANFANNPYILLILPTITVGLVTLFLGLSVVALRHYR